MTCIKPISDLRNYNEVLKDVDINGLVYLTRNGNGAYGILTINEIDEYMRLKALHGLLTDLDRSKQRADREGWISEEDIDKVMDI